MIHHFSSQLSPSFCLLSSSFELSRRESHPSNKYHEGMHFIQDAAIYVSHSIMNLSPFCLKL